METSISDAKYAVVHAQNDRSCLGPIETCCSGPKVAVLQTYNSVPKEAVLQTTTTDEGWEP